MRITETELEGVYIIQPEVHGDDRGWFMESYSKRNLQQLPGEFVQDNHSCTRSKNVLRGIHYQQDPHSQAKLVRCTLGAVLDIAVDLRKGSPTYKKWLKLELSAENKTMLYIPKGFGHGFLTLTEDVEFIYKTDEYYHPESDRSIRFDDPELAIDWGTEEPVLSDKDRNAPFLNESDCNYIYEARI